jgi:hypothetical protein
MLHTSPFENGNTYGKTSKRGASKNTIVIKEYLEKICNELIKDMNLGKLTNNQRINLVKAILPYLLPKKKEVENLNQFTEQPLFEVNVIDSDDMKKRLDRFEAYAKDNNIDL